MRNWWLSGIGPYNFHKPRKRFASFKTKITFYKIIKEPKQASGKNTAAKCCLKLRFLCSCSVSKISISRHSNSNIHLKNSQNVFLFYKFEVRSFSLTANSTIDQFDRTIYCFRSKTEVSFENHNCC